jgi:peptidoglycan LD-endopeptidase LytH
MKRLATLFLFISLIHVSCNTTISGIFAKKSAHEEYAEKVEDRLSKTPEGRQWLAASEQAIHQPYQVKLPYRQHGIFLPDKSRAMGIRFSGNAGEQLRFVVTKRSLGNFSIFADVFLEEGSGRSVVYSADTSSQEFIVNIDQPGNYILRLQPVLSQVGEYSVSVALGPSLEYPVPGNKARAGSFWGASRDGGKRRHEGIDIFAPKKSPVIASANGMVTGVKNEGIGGKTIWLRAANRNVTLYYAHLDSQLVQPGQEVKEGDVIGTVGNTGNARTTPSHLHFGIYTVKGPIDPLPFINKTIREAPFLSKLNFDRYVRTKKAFKEGSGVSIPENTVLIPLALDAKGYISELPGGQLVSLPASAVKTVNRNDMAASGFPTTNTSN